MVLVATGTVATKNQTRLAVGSVEVQDISLTLPNDPFTTVFRLETPPTADIETVGFRTTVPRTTACQ